MSTDTPSTSYATVRSLHFPAPSSKPPSRPPSPVALAPVSTPERVSPITADRTMTIEPSESLPLEIHSDGEEEVEEDSSSLSEDESVSSFPSITSSFFFSSAAASPRQIAQHSSGSSSRHNLPPHGHSKLCNCNAEDGGLIIPSLELPAPLQRPTAYGETIGEIRLVVVGTGCRELVDELLLVDKQEGGVIVDPGIWVEEEDLGSVRKASTLWEESGKGKGNIVFVAVDDWDDSLLPILHVAFDTLHALIAPSASPTNLLARLISSSNTPLYTAIILSSSASSSASSSPTSLSSLSSSSSLPPSLNHTHIPIISLEPIINTSPTHAHPHAQTHHHAISHYLSASVSNSSPMFVSSFKPDSVSALRKGLLDDPYTLKKIREECAMGFLRWREIEKAVESIRNLAGDSMITGARRPLYQHQHSQWHDDDRTVLGPVRDWEAELSVDVARRLVPKAPLSPTISRMYAPPQVAEAEEFPFSSSSFHGSGGGPSSSCAPTALSFDPLHFPSLVLFSLSLLGPLRSKLARALGLSAFLSRLPTPPNSRTHSGSIARSEYHSLGTDDHISLGPMGTLSRRSRSRAQHPSRNEVLESSQDTSNTSGMNSSGSGDAPPPSWSKRRRLGWLSLGIGLGIGLGAGLGVMLSLRWQGDGVYEGPGSGWGFQYGSY